MATPPVVDPNVATDTWNDVQQREAAALIGLLHAWRHDDPDDQREILDLLEAELPLHRVHLPERGAVDE